MAVFGAPFGEIIVAIFLVVVAVVAIRCVISFDINKYLESRHSRRKERLQILCPHARIEKNRGKSRGGKFVVRGLFYSPRGTRAWICSRCGMQTYDDIFAKNTCRYYAENIALFLTREKEFENLMQKIYKYK